MTLLEGYIHLAFAFDVGYEIDLDRARPLLSAEAGTLARRKRTPESLEYRPTPLRVSLDASGLALPGVAPSAPPRAELSIFDFGAISLLVSFPIKLDEAAMLALADDLAEPSAMVAAAKLVISPWLERIKPMVTEFKLSDLGEEYIVFQLGEQTPSWFASHREWIAGLVRLDSGPLGESEVHEANRLSLSYRPTDLVTLDWAAGFVADKTCADLLQVIEFANVQLLEFRHIDDRLDDRLEAAYRLIRPGHAPRRFRLPLWRTHAGAVRSVRELEIEATSLFERADNTLKLIGDQYLSRVFDLARTRFHLADWQQSIRRKLETVGDVFDLLVHQAGGTRMEVLEIVVILLIALEIGLAIWRH
jgi:hypothetical protein